MQGVMLAVPAWRLGLLLQRQQQSRLALCLDVCSSSGSSGAPGQLLWLRSGGSISRAQAMVCN